jgi:hypothetical protein
MSIRTRTIAATLLCAATLTWLPTAHAGRSCEARPVTARVIESGMTLAQRTAQALDAEYARSGARVVLLARAGQDLTKYGLRYSHLGFAYRTPEGPWRVLHKLNQCGTATASLYRQGLGEFFMDDLWRYEAAWVVPAASLQEGLYARLTDPQKSTELNVRDYNMVGYPWSGRYQQSNQWALEVFAASQEGGIRDREQARAWLRFKGYQPSVLRIGTLERLGGRVGMANVAFDDHPPEQRYAGRIETSTVDSVFQWMPRAGLSGPLVRLTSP